jgi:hypothetical protein
MVAAILTTGFAAMIAAVVGMRLDEPLHRLASADFWGGGDVDSRP